MGLDKVGRNGSPGKYRERGGGWESKEKKSSSVGVKKSGGEVNGLGLLDGSNATSENTRLSSSTTNTM